MQSFNNLILKLESWFSYWILQKYIFRMSNLFQSRKNVGLKSDLVDYSTIG